MTAATKPQSPPRTELESIALSLREWNPRNTWLPLDVGYAHHPQPTLVFCGVGYTSVQDWESRA